MRIFVSLLAVALIGSGCDDATSPRRQQQTILAINVKPTAAVSDTIRVSFSVDGNPCNTDAKIETEFPADGVRFTASNVPADGVCPLSAAAPVPVDAIPVPFIYLVSPPHLIPYTVRFAEPGQADSVRIVQAP